MLSPVVKNNDIRRGYVIVSMQNEWTRMIWWMKRNNNQYANPAQYLQGSKWTMDYTGT